MHLYIYMHSHICMWIQDIKKHKSDLYLHIIYICVIMQYKRIVSTILQLDYFALMSEKTSNIKIIST